MNAKRYFKGIRGDVRRWWAGLRWVFQAYRPWLILFWVLVILGTLLLMTLFDPVLTYPERERTFIHYFSMKLRKFGDFRDTLFFTLTMLAGGYVLKRRTWRMIAVTIFLSGCLSGITTNALRFTAGRPRPKMLPQTAWVGPTLNYHLQSFPSGHTGTSLGMSSALLRLYPPLGVPAFAISCGIGWASMDTRNHYPSDVFFGAAIGIFWGSASAAAARHILRRKGIKRSSPRS